MSVANVDGVRLHYRDEGPARGAGGGTTLAFVNSLGTDLRLWDGVVAALPEGRRIVRQDMRGHGLSDCPGGPWSIDALADDVFGLLCHLGVTRCTLVGLSIGGLVAQRVAARHPEILAGLVLSSTAARIGTPEAWRERIDRLREHGLAAEAGAILERWFSAPYRERTDVSAWRERLLGTPLDGYLRCCEVLADTDLSADAGGLGLPTLVVAGTADEATPPALVRATAAMIDGARYHELDGAAHLPCIEAPARFAGLLDDFLRERIDD